MITIDDFHKVEIKIGTVISAEKAEGTDRLLKLIFDFGDDPSTSSGRETGQIMSAIAEYYPDPSELVGMQIAVCVNLEPRKFKGYESQGMILATGDEKTPISLMVPEKKVEPGSKIH